MVLKEVRHDTIYRTRDVHDSIFEREVIRHVRDTLYVERFRYKERTRVDTLLHTTRDTIPVRVVVPQHVPYVPRFYRYCAWIVIALAFAFFGYVAIKCYLH